MSFRSAAAAALAAALFASTAFAADPVELKLDRSRDKFNLGLADFAGASGVAEVVPQTVNSVIGGDLKFSNLFNLVEKGPAVHNRNDAPAWKKIGSDVVVAGDVRKKGADQIELDATLFDTGSGKELATISKRGGSGAVRDLSHQVSNEIVKYFTGQPGVFDSKIVFANNATGRKELYIADYDARNAKRLTNDNSIVVLPRMSPDGSKIIFTSYISGNPDLYIINRDGTGRHKLSAKAGLNVSPSWAPNNQQIAITLSIDGPPNIYLMDLTGAVKQRLTTTQGADTAP
ncbi:MAG: PD40 domain-containing protein, partial [Elusimicrobia bacterium]|nr:PD40 domain-containing protein [Elusimicrobiota bacterium]